MSQSNPPKPKGRPALSSDQVKARRANIVACAEKLFQTEGYEAVSMRRLAQEAGVTVMTLYKYYDRKIDVLRDLWGRVFEDLFAKLEAEAVLSADPREKLHKLAHGYVAYWLARRDHYFLVFMSGGVTQPDVSVFVKEDPVIARFDIFYRTLAAAISGRIDEDDFLLRGQLLLCNLNGIAHNLITISAYPWQDPERLTRLAVDALLA